MDVNVVKMMISMAVCGLCNVHYLELKNGFIYKNFELLSINNQEQVSARDLTPGEEELFTFTFEEVATVH